MQDCDNFIALAMGLLQSCTKPSVCIPNENSLPVKDIRRFMSLKHQPAMLSILLFVECHSFEVRLTTTTRWISTYHLGPGIPPVWGLTYDILTVCNQVPTRGLKQQPGGCNKHRGYRILEYIPWNVYTFFTLCLPLFCWPTVSQNS